MRTTLHTLFRPKQGSGRTASYKYTERLPSPSLAPYVSCYWMAEPVDDDELSLLSRQVSCPEPVDRVLPDGCTDILFEYDLSRNSCRILYCGLFDQSFTVSYDYNRPVRRFAVRFFPGGAHALTGIFMSEFSNAHYDAELIWPGLTKEIGERIFEQPSFDAKIRVMERYLLSFIGTGPADTSNDLLNNLLYRIFVTGGKTSVQELAEKEAVSARQMNRIFYRWIGASPKKFCEVVRFQAVIHAIQSARCRDGAILALHHGYFDQAHMIRDFQRFYGDSPLTAVKEFRNMSDSYNHESF